MEIKLRRVEYTQVGTVSPKCLCLLPPAGGSPLQKVCVASQDGVLFSFGRKKVENVVAFKTLPGPKIECLSLGGALGTPQDKLFVACGASVKGISRKGKQFFAFDTDLAERIAKMYVYGVDMFLCGTYTFNHYHDCKSYSYYLCGDKINDVLCLPVVQGSWVGRGITPVLACDDRTIKVLDQSKLAYEVPLGGQPTVLRLFQNNGGSDGKLVLYGTKDGKIGLVDLPTSVGTILWETNATGSAGVSCIECYDITLDGLLDLIIGRDDGSIDIFVYDENDRPKFLQTFACNETIMSLSCGRVTSPNFDEIVVCTYSGCVFALTTEPAYKEVGPDANVAAIDPTLQNKLAELRAQLDTLTNQVAVEREKYQRMTQSAGSISAVPVFAVNDRFMLVKEEAAYILSVELQVAIDYVMLQCDVPVDLLDLEKNSAVVSLTPCAPGTSNSLIATYRCQANTTRLEIKIRSIEGQYGVLRAYVSPRMHPKSCQVREYNLKPLSLHQRAHRFDESRPQNVLRVSGNFSLAEAHSWVYFCLPEFPEKPPIDAATSFCFVSTFTGTLLDCSYNKNTATFRSDCISTIAIIKDVLNKEATKKKIRLDINCNMNDDSVPHVLRLIHPTLESQINLAKKVQLIEALRELSTQEDIGFLSVEYADVLNNADKIQAEYKKQQAHLERIYGMITDLYIDKYKFKGINVKHKIPQLLQILDNYTLDSLIQFFITAPSSG